MPGPVPAIMDGQVAKQGLIAGEEFPQGIQEQRLAEASWPGEEVVLASSINRSAKPVLST